MASFFNIPGLLNYVPGLDTSNIPRGFTVNLANNNRAVTTTPSNTSVSSNNQTVDNKQNEDNQSQNIFGERLAQALLPGIPQNNKQLIDAAILRGSLELLKPRQAGENFASQLGRGLEAASKLGADIEKRELEKLTTQAALAKAQQGRQVSVTKEKRATFENTYDSLLDTNPNFKNAVDKITGFNFGFADDDLKNSIVLEAMVYNANTGGSPTEAMIAIANQLSGTSNTQTNSTKDRFADRKIKERIK